VVCMIYFSFSTAAMTEKLPFDKELDKKALVSSSSPDTNDIELTDMNEKFDNVSRQRASTISEIIFNQSDGKNSLDKTNSFVFRTFLVTVFNFACMLTINIYYVTIVKAEDIDQDVKVMVQFAVSIYMCFWNSIAVGFMVTQLKPGIPTEIFLRSFF